MMQKNENIHQFIIEEEYLRKEAKQNFSTTSCALEEIFGANYKLKSFRKKRLNSKRIVSKSKQRGSKK
jgi:hypothetical protein